MNNKKINYNKQKYNDILTFKPVESVDHIMDNYINFVDEVDYSPKYFNGIRNGKKQAKFDNLYFNNKRKDLQINIKNPSIAIIGLGNVGGTFLIGLRMLIKNNQVSKVGIYDRNLNISKRYELEINQIHSPFGDGFVDFEIINQLEEVLDYDYIYFIAAQGIPSLDSKLENVRNIQFKENSKILDNLINLFNDNPFKGIVNIISDPVDILCTYLYRNSDLQPSQITGMGLGVMAGRANYALRKKGYLDFFNKGIVLGPHNQGVIVIPDVNNSIEKDISEISYEVEKLNFKVRELGFLPYISPAISSVAYNTEFMLENYPILSCTFIDGIYWGFNNIMTKYGCAPLRIDVNKKFRDLIIKQFEFFKKETNDLLQ